MPAALRRLGNDDAETALKFGRDERKDPAIRLTINQIVEVARFALMPALVQNPAALEPFTQQITEFPLLRLAKFSFVDIVADDDVGLQRLEIGLLHVAHKLLCGFER